MIGRSNRGGRRFACQLLIGTAIGAGVLWATSQTASAATTATFSAGVLSVFGDNADQQRHDQPGRGRDDPGERRSDSRRGRLADGRQHHADPGVRPRRQRRDQVSTRRTAPCRGPTCSAAPATTPSPAVPAATSCSARAATTSCPAAEAQTCCSGAPRNDVLTGGDADDQAFGETGDDRMVWNPGDDTDLNEGGAGVDTVEVNGGNGAEVFTATVNGLRVRFDRARSGSVRHRHRHVREPGPERQRWQRQLFRHWKPGCVDQDHGRRRGRQRHAARQQRGSTS